MIQARRRVDVQDGEQKTLCLRSRTQRIGVQIQ
jgi:hypothetical protein